MKAATKLPAEGERASDAATAASREEVLDELLEPVLTYCRGNAPVTRDAAIPSLLSLLMEGLRPMLSQVPPRISEHVSNGTFEMIRRNLCNKHPAVAEESLQACYDPPST